MIYKSIIKPILFKLPIERSHRLVLYLLRIIGMLPGGKWLLKKCYSVESASLEREVYGMHFKNPIGLAAGFDVDADCFEELDAIGFGFVEIGTITPSAQRGNPCPRVFRLHLDSAVVNRMGRPNKGLEHAINSLRKRRYSGVVGCNIGCNSDTPPERAWKDYLKVFRNLYQYADYFTVNIYYENGAKESSAPSNERLMQILEPLFDFRRGQNQYRPILLKLSPDLTDEEVDRMTDLMIETPLDGLVAVCGTNSRAGLQTSLGSLAKVGGGRLSGRPLTNRAIEVVNRIFTRSKGTYPIIGVGGIMSAEDALNMLKAGASLVQVYSGFIYSGPSFVGDICRALILQSGVAKGVHEQAVAEKPTEGDSLTDNTPVSGDESTKIE